MTCVVRVDVIALVSDAALVVLPARARTWDPAPPSLPPRRSGTAAAAQTSSQSFAMRSDRQTAARASECSNFSLFESRQPAVPAIGIY